MNRLTRFNAIILRPATLSLLVAVLLIVCSRKVSDEDLKRQSSANVQGTSRSAFDFVNSIGVNTHLNYFDRIYGNFPLMETKLKSVGILHLRDGVHLQNRDYNEALYGRWIKLGGLGIRFDAVLDPRSNLGPVNAALLEQVDALAGHTIESFEGPNELDIGKMADWPSIDRSYESNLFDSTRSMTDASQIKVIGPSLAFASNSSQLGDIGAHIDEANIHPYPAGKMPSAIFPDQINLARVMAHGKEIVFTESGYHNAINDDRGQPGVSEAAAAKYVPRLFLENFAHGVVRTYLYELMDEAPNPGLTDAELHWGLVRADGSEKPAFFAMKNLIAELNDTAEPARLRQLTWTLNATAPRIHHLLLEKSNGEFDIVFWQEISSYDLRRQVDIDNPGIASVLTLDHQARSIAIFDPVKQSGPVHTYHNVESVQLGIPDEPLIVRIVF